MRGWCRAAPRPGRFLNREGPRSVWGGARGWNADQFGRPVLRAPSTAPSGVRGPESVRGSRFVGTLLGPEGTGRPCGGAVVSVQGRPASRTAVLPVGMDGTARGHA